MNHTTQRAALWSAAITIPAIALLTIIAELTPPVKDWLAATFAHHWIGKGIAMVIAYVVLFAVCVALRSPKKQDAATLTGLRALNVLAIVSSIALFLFFWWHAGI